MVDPTALLADLTDESDQLDALVAALPTEAWTRPTPAPGWTVAHQIAHLAWTDHVARLAATDPAAFYASVTSAADPGRLVEDGVGEFLAPPAVLLDRWRSGRAALTAALTAVPAGGKLPWYGTRMSAPSMVTARIMETWAHGEDVAEALGVTRTPTARLRHVAHLGFRTLGHGFAAHGRPVPTTPVRVALAAPDGSRWASGRPTRRTGSSARRSTSACWSPSAGTAPTSPWSPPARPPTRGSTWPRPSPGRPAPAGNGSRRRATGGRYATGRPGPATRHPATVWTSVRATA